jgi:hypothetical protein
LMGGKSTNTDGDGYISPGGDRRHRQEIIFRGPCPLDSK